MCACPPTTPAAPPDGGGRVQQDSFELAVPLTKPLLSEVGALEFRGFRKNVRQYYYSQKLSSHRFAVDVAAPLVEGFWEVALVLFSTSEQIMVRCGSHGKR